MCGTLNEVRENIALSDDVGKVCILCAQPIKGFESVHRSHDGEIVHEACFNDLNDEDAHFYEAPGEEIPNV